MPEGKVKDWLEKQIRTAVADGFVTFLSGMAMGVDLWAAAIVLQLREENPSIHLIACIPWPGFAAKWKEPWKSMYYSTMKKADFRVCISDHYENGVFRKRNEYMIDRSARVIAVFNGSPGGTKDTLSYAAGKGIEVVVNRVENRLEKGSPPAADYPECLLTDIGLDRFFPEEIRRKVDAGEALTRAEYRKYTWYAVLGGLTVVGVIGGGTVLFIFLLTLLWR